MSSALSALRPNSACSRCLSVLLPLLFLFSSCSVQPLLVIDPYIQRMEPEAEYPGAQTVTVDGDYPWTDSLENAVAASKATEVLLSPFLHYAAVETASGFPEHQFFVISPGEEFSVSAENVFRIPISRMEAMKHLQEYIRQYLAADTEANRVFLMLYTGNQQRVQEIDFLLSALSSYPVSRVSVQRYPSLPSVATIQQEISTLAVDSSLLLVVLLAEQVPETLEFVAEKEFRVITENIGRNPRSSFILGSIEYNFPAAVRAVLNYSGENLQDFAAQAEFMLYDDAKNGHNQ